MFLSVLPGGVLNAREVDGFSTKMRPPHAVYFRTTRSANLMKTSSSFCS